MWECVWGRVIRSKCVIVCVRVKYAKACSLSPHVSTCVHTVCVCIDMCCHTPTRLLLLRDYCSACVSWGTFWLVKKAVFWLPDSLIISGEEQGNQPRDRKTQVSFPLSSFLPLPFAPSGIQLNVSWHSLAVCRMEMKKWKEKWENGARGARLGRYKRFSPSSLLPDFYTLMSLKKKRKKKGRVKIW